MKQANRKKLETIARKVVHLQFQEMGKGSKGNSDEEYAEALRILGDALKEIEETFGVEL
ncbi:hypothetical protein [Paenibacillus larvae]|uniref:hypothetical protein n=1 Tax=Paenibacillus larvae TaxID=1464 RepID=UPI0013142BB9|nr:hypothetical protein [Paenibacillus larvae]